MTEHEDKSNLLAFIERTEQQFFRTHNDYGANNHSLLIWNEVRENAGLPKITRRDLMQRTINLYKASAEGAMANGNTTAAKRYIDAAEVVAKEFDAL